MTETLIENETLATVATIEQPDLATLEADANAADAAAWQQMKLSYARGEQIDFSELRRLGHTTDELNEARGLYAKRCHHANKLEAGRNANQVIADAELEVHEELARFEIHQKEHEANMAVIRAKIMSAESAKSHVKLSENALFATCKDPRPFVELNRIERQWDKHRRDDVKLRADLSNLQGVLQTKINKREEVGEVSIAETRKNIETVEQRLKELHAASEALNGAYKAAKAQTFDPESI